jgi:hypothetical protein
MDLKNLMFILFPLAKGLNIIIIQPEGFFIIGFHLKASLVFSKVVLG